MVQAVAPWLLALVVGVPVSAAVPCGGYEIEILPNIPCPGPLPDVGIQGRAINNAGVVTGVYTDACTFGDLIQEGFTWTPETGIVTIPYPREVTELVPADISDAGLVVGTHGISDIGLGFLGFMYDGKRLINLGTLPGGTNSEAHGVNSAGVVVGWWGNTVTGVPTGSDAFIWRDAKMTGLGTVLGTPRSAAHDVNESGALTGWMGSSIGVDDVRAFVLKGAALTVLPPVPGGLTSVGQAISNDDWVAGFGKIELPGGDIALRCFIWDGQAMTRLDPLPGTLSCRVAGMTRNHDVIGYCYDGPDFDTRPFLWSEGVMYELRDLVRFDGLILFDAEGVNDHGEIVIDANLGGDGVVVVLRPVIASFADFNCSGTVGLDDLQILLSAWGPCSGPSCPTDLDGNGFVNGYDLALLLGSWS